jgi:hypothetical protein
VTFLELCNNEIVGGNDTRALVHMLTLDAWMIMM